MEQFSSGSHETDRDTILLCISLLWRELKKFSTSPDSPKETQPAPFIGECSTILRIAGAFRLVCPSFGLRQARSEYLQLPHEKTNPDSRSRLSGFVFRVRESAR
jgi:hypothetical protein